MLLVRLVALALLALATSCAAQDYAAVLAIRFAWPGLANRWVGGCSATVTDCRTWDFLTWDLATHSYVTDIEISKAPFVLNTTAAQLAWPPGTRANRIFSHLLAEIFMLSQLSFLSIADQNLQCLPSDISTLTALNYLELRSYSVGSPSACASIPLALSSSNLPNLQNIILSDALIDGPWPTIWLSGLTSVVRLDLFWAQFSGLTQFNFSSLPALQFCDIDPLGTFNQRVQYPSWLPTIQWEELGASYIYNGPFLPFVNTPNLKSIRLDFNNFTGQPLPPVINLRGSSSICSLECISFAFCGFTNGANGGFPYDYLTCSNLVTLDVSGVDMHGDIFPLNFTTATPNLKSLFLNSVNMTGTIPPSLAVLPMYEFLVSDNPRLSGTLPTAFSNWTGISTLWLDNTNLTGTIPVQWASMAQSLTQFSVENTLLSGVLPPWVSQIGGRVYLRGTIFANCSYAPYIEVSDGYQSPSVPASEFIMDPGTVYRICLFTCPLPPPFGNNSLCINDTWVTNNIVIPDGQNFTLNGTITVNGTYVQQPNGTLVIIIGGQTNGTIVQVLGNATVSGTLQIILSGPLTANTSVQVITSPSLSGSFTNVDVKDAGGGCYTTQQTATNAGIAVLLSPSSGCSPSQTTSASGAAPPRSKSKPNYALIGGLLGGIVGFFVLVLIVAVIIYKARACRWLFESREDELII